MGLTRKMMSMGTLGAVDYRSDKERTAAYTKGMRKEARKQTELMKKQQQQGQQAAGWNPPPATGQWSSAGAAMPAAPTSAPTPPPAPPSAPPAGWYPDANAPGIQRYWDGAAWNEHTAPL